MSNPHISSTDLFCIQGTYDYIYAWTYVAYAVGEQPPCRALVLYLKDPNFSVYTLYAHA